MVGFERATKQRYGLGPINQDKVEEGLDLFRTSAALLDAELSDREWLLGRSISYADFRMASFLPFNDAARLPMDDYPSVVRWYRRIEAIEAWSDPFKGLHAPELPPVPTA